MIEPVKVGAILDSISTRKDKSLKIIFESQEVSADQATNLFSLRDQSGWLVFAPREVEQVMIPDEPPLEFRSDKSPSQRLRGALFVLWEQSGKSGSFDEFYRIKMERFISLVKEKLD